MNNWHWTRYTPRSLLARIYMMQACDYDPKSYRAWLRRTNNLHTVSKRGSLRLTIKAILLIAFLTVMYIVVLGAVTINMYYGLSEPAGANIILALLLLVFLSPILTYVLIPVLWVGGVIIQKPRTRRAIQQATNEISRHPGKKIAVAGSYGKTTMKETLKTILSVKLDTAATPGNLNTPLGTATFVTHLSGQEEVIIFELGESHVGDVMQLSNMTQPDMGIITGINEAHLESFGNIERTVETIFELKKYLGDKPLYKNAESELVAENTNHDDCFAYTTDGVHGWRVYDIKSGLTGTSFRAQKNDIDIELHSGLLGEYQVGPLIACIDIAYELGLSAEQIIEGVQYTKPFAHRMQPRQSANQAWIIDDTYNGNPQGVAAGLNFLRTISTDGRKIYVTPGLVEQGSATEDVHKAIGRQAAFCDVVVLMKNSTTKYIQAGLEDARFKGELIIIEKPLDFYRSIDSFVKKGDVALLQNDWTDNYS